MSDLEFCFDFGSPNAYLAYGALPGLLERTDVRLIMKPVLLGGIFKATNNQSPFVAMAGIQGKIAYEQLEIHRFIKKYGLTEFTMNTHFPVNTLKIMRGAVVADMEDFLPAYVEAVMACMWEQSRKMDDTDVIVEALTSYGLDGAHIAERSQGPEVKQQLINNTEEAVARGAFGVPTFFIGEEMWFGKDRLHQVEDHLLNA